MSYACTPSEFFGRRTALTEIKLEQTLSNQRGGCLRKVDFNQGSAVPDRLGFE